MVPPALCLQELFEAEEGRVESLNSGAGRSPPAGWGWWEGPVEPVTSL